VVVVEEMPEMEERKNSLVTSNDRMRKELQDLEDQILSMLSNYTGIMSTLYVSQ
jgi:dynein heavy chain